MFHLSKGPYIKAFIHMGRMDTLHYPLITFSAPSEGETPSDSASVFTVHEESDRGQQPSVPQPDEPPIHSDSGAEDGRRNRRTVGQGLLPHALRPGGADAPQHDCAQVPDLRVLTQPDHLTKLTHTHLAVPLTVPRSQWRMFTGTRKVSV